MVPVQYSTNPRVNAFVARLIDRIDELNPYAQERCGTIAGVIEVIRFGFGDEEADAVRITVH
jgi:hypothetical protein